MDAIEYLKVKARMCGAYNCNKCDLYHVAHMEDHMGCTGFEKEFPEKAVEIVERWAKEHPVKTRQSEFLKLFPNAELDEDGILYLMPCRLDRTFPKGVFEKCYKTNNCTKCRKDYWLSEVEDEQ